MDVVSETELWATGKGAFYHYQNGEWSVVEVEGLSEASAADLSMVSTQEGWAVGWGNIYHYQNGVWRVAQTFPHRLSTIDMVSPTEGWVMGASIILHYKDGQWQIYDQSQPGLDQLEALALAPPDAQGQTAVWTAGEGQLARYQNGVWELVEMPFDQQVSQYKQDFVAIDMVGPEEGWFAEQTWTDHENLWHYQAGEWALHAVGANDIDMVNREEGWTVNDTGEIFHYRDGTWQLEITTSGRLEAVSMGSSEAGWAVGAKGLMVQYHDGIWTEIPKITDEPLETVQMFSPTEGWAAGRDVLLRYQNGEWREVGLPFQGKTHIYAMHFLDINEGWLVYHADHVLHYHDGTWSKAPLPRLFVTGTGADILMLNQDEGWLVGDGGLFQYVAEP